MKIEKLGPMKGGEKRLMAIAIVLLCSWILEGKTWGMSGMGGDMDYKNPPFHHGYRGFPAHDSRPRRHESEGGARQNKLLIPIIIAVLQEVSQSQPGISIIGLDMILQYTVNFGFILPINAPQNMIRTERSLYRKAVYENRGSPHGILCITDQ